METQIIGKNVSIWEFCNCLGSSMPAPGGGGAAALCAALGTCLMRMVGSLTVGKKRYAEFEPEIRKLMEECSQLSDRFLDLIAEDAENFLPLSQAYAIPKDDPNRNAMLEKATMTALKTPMETLELLKQASGMLKTFLEKGSKLAVSDTGCAASMIRSAAESAILNVFINTKALKDPETARMINAEATRLLREITVEADQVYREVRAQLEGENIG